jgi:hypothetical protein
MMTLNIELTPEQEARLVAIARREGIDPAEVVKKLVAEHLPATLQDEEQDPMLSLFAQWDKEDQSLVSAEIAEENRTWEEFKANINAERDRAGSRRVF